MTDPMSRRTVFKVLGISTLVASVSTMPAGVRLALDRVGQPESREVLLLTGAGVVLGRGEFGADNVTHFPSGVATGVIERVVLPKMTRRLPQCQEPQLDPGKPYLTIRRTRGGGWIVTAAARVLDVAPVYKCAGDTLRVVFNWTSVV